MNFSLATNDDSKVLRMENLKRLDIESFSAELSVRSGNFFAERCRFYFDLTSLQSTLSALNQMNRTFQGEGTLKAPYEHDKLHFSVSPTGKVTVAGELYVYSPPTQHLKFSFTTDQTCLSPFIQGLEACLTL